MSITLDEANEILVNNYGWSRDCHGINERFEWSTVKAEWLAEGEEVAINNFMSMRNALSKSIANEYRWNHRSIK